MYFLCSTSGDFVLKLEVKPGTPATVSTGDVLFYQTVKNQQSFFFF